MSIEWSTGVKRFFELKKIWNNGLDLFSDYYTVGSEALQNEWMDWFKADELGVTEWSVIGRVAKPVQTKNLLACHKSHAAQPKSDLLTRCVKAAHSADLTKEDEVNRFINFLRYARHTDQSPYFLKVEGVFKEDSNNGELSRYCIITEPPCISLGKLNSRIMMAHHAIVPPIMDEIIRELLNAINFLHERNIKHNAISNDTIVCKSPTSIVPVALVDINYCGENYLDENTEWHPDCPEEYQKPRKDWVHYRYGEKDGRFVSLNGCHMIAPEVVRNHRRLNSQGGQSDFEEVGAAVDIYNLGAVVFELAVNRNVLFLLQNKCGRHTGVAGELPHQRHAQNQYTFSKSYDLENCRECQDSYLENVKIFHDRREHRSKPGLWKLHGYGCFRYYGRKYLNFIDNTLSYEPRERSPIYDLLMMWEDDLRGLGARAIKEACANPSDKCITDVPSPANRCLIWLDTGLLQHREDRAESLGESLITNNLIRICYEGGSSGYLSLALGKQMVTHVYNQIALDDADSKLHHGLHF